MKIVTKPFIKQGWLRALICFAGISLIASIFSNYSSAILSQSGAGTEKGDNSVLQFGIIYSIMGTLILLFIWLLRTFLDRKSFKSLGLTWEGYTNEAALGIFTAFALLGTGSIILAATGSVYFTGITFNAIPLLLEILLMLIVAFVEELLFRGYLLNNLMQSIHKWGALSITAALFSLYHTSNPDVTFFAVINIFIAGILLGLNYIFTKNLWFGIFFHFAWNYFQGPILGYNVSGLKLTTLLQQTISGSEALTGGLFGFEGSLLCPLLTAAAVLIFSYAFVKRYEHQ